MKVTWYAQRLFLMSPREIAGRIRDVAVKRAWRRLQVYSSKDDLKLASVETPLFTTPLHSFDPKCVPKCAQEALIRAADALLTGRWNVFAVKWENFDEVPDWFLDIKTGIRAPERSYAFSIPHRDEKKVGNIKYIWEPSRLHQITLLAAAFFLTNDERYAERAAAQLNNWWHKNPFLSGIHWVSGIEVGIRLISFVWVRRLLHNWSGVQKLFEKNHLFLTQLFRHQIYLATLGSHGSSANNHLFLEKAGLFVSTCAFPFFDKSQKWREKAAIELKRELALQTFPDGHNKEQASAYHGFVLEAAIIAGLEGEVTGESLGAAYWSIVCKMCDALATTIDSAGRAPRQGDSDDGSALLLDDPAYDRWSSLLNTGSQLFGAQDWWPKVGPADVRTSLFLALASQINLSSAQRPKKRLDLLPDAGMALLRDKERHANEIWCRCDHGPHGYLSLAAHAHADALSLELRHGGVDVFADPGTYCYHGEPQWRNYFRSTRAHNTLELAGQDQSKQEGAFMWRTQARTKLVSFHEDIKGQTVSWHACHFGYENLNPPVIHHRKVVLDRAERCLAVEDWLEGKRDSEHHAVLSWHLGPLIDCHISNFTAKLEWNCGAAILELPRQLKWHLEKEQNAPPVGWYSSRFDQKTPSFSLRGIGDMGVVTKLATTINFSS